MHDTAFFNVIYLFIQQKHWTALHSASNNGHAEVVGVLLAAKATVNTQDKVSSTLSALSRHMT